ncbi:MAG: phosphoribosylglycinamide formyltransferase [Phycisphaerales bacterium]|nr:phosphoribosylglycinamide formyltransferase [Phycisphaerales bacterium]
MSFDELDKFHSPTRLAVLLSGSGTTLDNLLRHIDSGNLDADVPVVIASKECLGAQKARDAGIPTVVHTGQLDSQMLDQICAQYDVDLVILAGYLKLVPISPRVQNRVINIHPALLPDFGGKGMHGMNVHRAVVESAKLGKIDRSGCTVHFADEHYDTGSTIIQLDCPIHETDTPDELAKRVFELECQAYPQAIKLLIDRNARAHSAE